MHLVSSAPALLGPAIVSVPIRSRGRRDQNTERIGLGLTDGAVYTEIPVSRL